MDINSFQKISRIKGENNEDTQLLIEMGDEALKFIKKFSWAPSIHESYLAYGIGGIVAIFFVEFSQKIQNTDQYLWIIVGDIPSAYLVVEQQDSPTSALERYCQMMDEWILKVKTSGDFKDVYPVDVAPTIENASALKNRINFFREEIIRE